MLYKLLITLLFFGFTLCADTLKDGKIAYYNGDKAAAAQLFLKACDDGNMNGCCNVATMYIAGKGVRQDKEKAEELFLKACDGGNTKGCYYLGAMYGAGDGVSQSNSRAKEYFGKACDGGFNVACKAYRILNEQGY